jgi:hypothetical protein
VKVRPSSAGAMVPMKGRPISAGTGWVNRVRSGAMTVMKDVPVFARIRSTYGCNTAVGSLPVTASRTSGEVIRLSTIAVVRCSALCCTSERAAA